jgi:2-dehydropantoate 2-reductase
MRILVFGAGSMGSFLAGMLSSEHDVTLYGRGTNIKTVDKAGIKITGKTEKEVKPKTLTTHDSLAEFSFDLIILTVKAYDTYSAMETLRLVKGEVPVLSLQNGLDNEVKIAKPIGLERTLGGVTSHGVTFVEPGHILHAGTGETIIGEMGGQETDKIKEIASAFSSAGIEAIVSQNIRTEIWTKGIVNAGINPLTALTGLKNGYLLSVPILTRLFEKTCLECVQVAQAEGFELNGIEMIKKTKNVARFTADNKSSMLQDIEKQRRTEIDSINGRIAKLGKKHAIATPVNSTLVGLIAGIEEGRGK